MISKSELIEKLSLYGEALEINEEKSCTHEQKQMKSAIKGYYDGLITFERERISDSIEYINRDKSCPTELYLLPLSSYIDPSKSITEEMYGLIEGEYHDSNLIQVTEDNMHLLTIVVVVMHEMEWKLCHFSKQGNLDIKGVKYQEVKGTPPDLPVIFRQRQTY